MATVRQLIENLMKEDLDSPVVYEFYIKDHFEHLNVSDEVWTKVAEANDSILVNDDASSVIEYEIKRAKEAK